MADKMRVHILAKQLKVSSKAILTKCSAEGLPVKNHMTALSAGLEATIREWFTDGQHSTTIETAARVDLKKVRITPRKRKTAEAEAASTIAEGTGAAATAVAEAPPEGPPSDDAVTTLAAPVSGDGSAGPAEIPAAAQPEAPGPSESEITLVVPSEPLPAVTESADPAVPVAEETAEPPTAPSEAEEAAERLVAETAGPIGDAPPEAPPAEPEPVEADPVAPAGPQNVPGPAQLKGPRVVRYEAPDRDHYSPPRTPRRRPSQPPAGPQPGPGDPRPPMEGERPGERRRHGPADARRRGKGGAAPQQRRTPSVRPSTEASAAEKLREWRDQDLLERRERLAGATGRRIHTRRAIEAQAGGPAPAAAGRKTSAEIQEPIRIKEFCSAVGMPFIQLMRTLQREHNMPVVSINTTLPTELAELVALDEGVELTVLKAKTQLDLLCEEFAERPAKDPGRRPPVVTLLGHVDHGKTSLLDRIRATRITDTEDGGITQHISSYHYEREGHAVTFLDTPGHAAFTAMRARGANMTDVVVLIVAADDGIMPQTVEAINHAKAAEVPIVVAITKIDLGHFDENRVYAQLAEHELTPSGTWGGETDVIKTSAVTGEGIDELLEHLTALGEVLELQADQAGDPLGTVIEAETREGVGAAVRVLVQGGALRPGSMIVCGNAYGKVRAILNDQGQRLKQAGPSTPCEIWGLDEVPSAGDRFYGVKSLQRAKSIAEETRHRRAAEARQPTQKARSLEELFKQREAGEIPELNVIIRADVDGSVDAIRYALGQLPSDQVTLALRHTGVGAVIDSDVLLADASDAIVIAFRVAPGANTRRLAEARGVDVREYKVIYDLIDDVTKALEGLLTPEEHLETRGTAEVREVFKISKVGSVAGCYLTDGVIARDHRVRLLREGVIIREDCRIDSLKRFKDDAKEVRSGMECGIRLERFDDIKQGDLLEAYEIVHVARTL